MNSHLDVKDNQAFLRILDFDHELVQGPQCSPATTAARVFIVRMHIYIYIIAIDDTLF